MAENKSFIDPQPTDPTPPDGLVNPPVPKEPKAQPTQKDLLDAINNLKSKIDKIEQNTDYSLSIALRSIEQDLKTIQQKLDKAQSSSDDVDTHAIASVLAGLKQTIGELPAKFDRLKASLDEFSNRTKQSLENLNNKNNGTNSVSYSDINRAVRSAVQDSLKDNTSKPEEIKKVVRECLNDEKIEYSSLGSLSSKVNSIDSYVCDVRYQAAGNFIVFTVMYAVICLLSALFMVTGWSSCPNEELLKATLSFVIISPLSMLILHAIYTLNLWYDEPGAKGAYYIIEGIINAVALGLSIAVLLVR